MATKRKNSKSTTKRQSRQNNRTADGNRQLRAIIWFALAVFFLCVVFIKGQNIWTFIHNFVFGLFGVTAYFYPFLLGFIAFMYASDKMQASAKANILEAVGITVLLSGVIDVFASPEGLSFWEHLTNAYTQGTALKNGGFLGGLIGEPIFAAFGKTGAAITLILLIFVLLMILTRTTLVSLFRAISKPVTVVKERAGEAYAKHIEEQNNRQFNIDLPVDDGPKERKKIRENMSPKQRRVIDSYQSDELLPEEPEEIKVYAPEGSQDREQMDAALKNAGEEEIQINLKEETENFTKELEELDESTDKGYEYPPITLLAPPTAARTAATQDTNLTAERLVGTLKSFGVETRIVDICRGPTVTRYELQPCAGVKISRITSLADDIALNLAAGNVRIEAPIPNKAAVGIEVPNKDKNTVGIREILEAPEFVSAKSKLTVALGKDISGNIITTDIAKMPHGLIAGATGSGKSVCTNSIIISLLYKNSPDELKLLLIDPKTVEFEPYNGIPHLMVPVITEPRKAAGALGWAVEEMEKRYKMLSDRKVRNIEEYNSFVETLKGEEAADIEKMPYIVIMIDEFADLMQTASKEVEDSISRIAAKARAAGIHLLLATQRPSVDVITGVIKANIPTRIALTTSSQIDSRTIIDSAGAEKLLGYGDMLFSPIGTNKPLRVQGCFVSNKEIRDVVSFIKNGTVANYNDEVMFEIERQAAIDKKQKTGVVEDGPDEDPLIKDAIRIVVEVGQASASLLQRKLKVGYSRAGRLIDEMEQRGVIGPFEGAKPRKVIITENELMEMEATSDE